MGLLDRFTDFIQKENLFQKQDRLLLAVSGGVDSVVLCELCFQGGYNFLIAHCNFKLRHKESERDKEFVLSLAEKYNCEIFTKNFDTNEYALEHRLSIQEAARKLRYDWFNKLTQPSDTPHSRLPAPDYILTAHHADDNVETLVMNFFRGTGIRGLRAILPKQGKIVRPLLPFRKGELVAFATEESLNWVEDSSNQSDKYSRNYFRQNIIPLVQKIYPETEQNLLQNIQRFADIELLYRQSVTGHLKNLLEFRGSEVHIPVLKLQKTRPLNTIIYEIVKQYDFTAPQVREVVKLMESETGKYIQSTTHRIIKNRNWLIIAPNANEKAENILIDTEDKIVMFAGGKLHFHIHGNLSLETSANIANLDLSVIHFPLLLRKWKIGDYFYPLGMKKKKKLSRLFIDQKLSKLEKEGTWVIEMNKKIVWVTGVRIDDRFKVTDQTKQVLSITLKRQ